MSELSLQLYNKYENKFRQYVFDLRAMQSLRLHDETKEAVKQKTEDKGGSAVPGETTQPIAT